MEIWERVLLVRKRRKREQRKKKEEGRPAEEYDSQTERRERSEQD
jgi:hypothetical protein